MVTYENDKVVLHPAHKPFFKEVPKKELQEVISYLYYYYINDDFQDILPEERYSLVTTDYCPNFNLEKHREIVEKFEMVYTSSTKKLAMAHLRKVEEVINIFYTNPVTIDNIEDQAKIMPAIEKMYALAERLKGLLSKEGKVAQGKGSKALGTMEETTFESI